MVYHPQIKIDQIRPAGTSYGVAGVARRDLWLSRRIALSVVDPPFGDVEYYWEFLDKPLGSTAAFIDPVGGGGGSSLAVPVFDPDLWGSYNIAVYINRTRYYDQKVASVLFDEDGIALYLGLRPPAFGEVPTAVNFPLIPSGYNSRGATEDIYDIIRALVPSLGAPADAQYLMYAASPALPNSRTVRDSTDIDIVSDGAGFARLDLIDTAVTPGTYTYTTVTVNQKGRITAISSGSSGALPPGTYDGDRFEYYSAAWHVVQDMHMANTGNRVIDVRPTASGGELTDGNALTVRAGTTLATDASGGDVIVTGGEATGTGWGGGVSIRGANNATGGVGGEVDLIGGSGTVGGVATVASGAALTGPGANVEIYASAGVGVAHDGGEINITAGDGGNATGTDHPGAGGWVSVIAGDSGTHVEGYGVGGIINLVTGLGTSAPYNGFVLLGNSAALNNYLLFDSSDGTPTAVNGLGFRYNGDLDQMEFNDGGVGWLPFASGSGMPPGTNDGDRLEWISGSWNVVQDIHLAATASLDRTIDIRDSAVGKKLWVKSGTGTAGVGGDLCVVAGNGSAGEAGGACGIYAGDGGNDADPGNGGGAYVYGGNAGTGGTAAGGGVFLVPGSHTGEIALAGVRVGNPAFGANYLWMCSSSIANPNPTTGGGLVLVSQSLILQGVELGVAAGGPVSVMAGSSVDAVGANVSLTASAGAGVGHYGGYVFITSGAGGNATGTDSPGAGGWVVVTAGDSGTTEEPSGAGGVIQLIPGVGTSVSQHGFVLLGNHGLLDNYLLFDSTDKTPTKVTGPGFRYNGTDNRVEYNNGDSSWLPFVGSGGILPVGANIGEMLAWSGTAWGVVQDISLADTGNRSISVRSAATARSITVQGGTVTVSGAGGAAYLRAGASVAAAGAAVGALAGYGVGVGNVGGSAYLQAGVGGTATGAALPGAGGNAFVIAGDVGHSEEGFARGGNVYLRTGAGTTGFSLGGFVLVGNHGSANNYLLFDSSDVIPAEPTPTTGPGFRYSASGDRMEYCNGDSVWTPFVGGSGGSLPAGSTDGDRLEWISGAWTVAQDIALMGGANRRIYIRDAAIGRGLSINSGSGTAGAGGIIDIAPGASTGAVGAGVSLSAGTGTTGFGGGSLTMYAGNSGGGDAGAGGSVYITAGSSSGNDNGGVIYLKPGREAGTGTQGSVIVGHVLEASNYLLFRSVGAASPTPTSGPGLSATGIDLTLVGGLSTGSTLGGDVYVVGGDNTGTGNAGSAALVGGDATIGNGGSVMVAGGDSLDAGDGGCVWLGGGCSSTGLRGVVGFYGGVQMAYSGFYARFDTQSVSTAYSSGAFTAGGRFFDSDNLGMVWAYRSQGWLITQEVAGSGAGGGMAVYGGNGPSGGGFARLGGGDAITSGAGGAAYLNAGASVDAAGANVSIDAGAGVGTLHAGGWININAGDGGQGGAGDAGAGGSVVIAAGDAGTDRGDAAGGRVFLIPGENNAAGALGAVVAGNSSDADTYVLFASADSGGSPATATGPGFRYSGSDDRMEYSNGDSVWRAFSSGGSTYSPWTALTPVTDYATTAAGAHTVTMNVDKRNAIQVGDPIRWMCPTPFITDQTGGEA